jgi:hypothetical protein
MNGKYRLMLVTEDFMFYANTSEEDTNNNTKMYNKAGELISNNYFAYEALFEECRQIAEEGKPYEYMDNELAENYKEWIKS